VTFIASILTAFITRKTFMLEMIKKVFRVNQPLFHDVEADSFQKDHEDEAKRDEADSFQKDHEDEAKRDNDTDVSLVKSKSGRRFSILVQQLTNPTREKKKHLSPQEQSQYREMLHNIKDRKVSEKDVSGIVSAMVQTRGSLQHRLSSWTFLKRLVMFYLCPCFSRKYKKGGRMKRHDKSEESEGVDLFRS